MMRVRVRRSIPLPGPFMLTPSPKRRPARHGSSGVGAVVVLLLVVVVVVWAIVAAIVHAA